MTRPPWFRAAVPVLLLVLAAALRLALLGDPDGIVFDETYYVDDARSQLAHGAEEGFAVHPPLGKWLIAVGMAILGDSAVGWRAAAAVAGTVVVLLTYLTARRLLPGSLGAAALAGLLVAVDGLLIVQSRIAMLDIFLAMFVVAAAWLITVDRHATTHVGADEEDPEGRPQVGPEAGPEACPETDPEASPETDRESGPKADPQAGRVGGGPFARPPLVRTHLVLAGVMLGLAVATKWSGLLALGGAGLYVIGAEVARRRRAGRGPLAAPFRLVTGVGLALVLVPAAVYALSWTGWLVGYPQTHEGRVDCVVDDEVLDPCPATVGDRVAGLARHHVAMWRFHTQLEAEHPYVSRAWTWPLMSRPIVYHWESCPASRASPDPEDDDPPDPCVVEEGYAQQIIAVGNPALWWTALLALIPLAVGAARRDPRAVFILTFWASQYVPWLIVDRPLFFFYMTPVVPFMAFGVAYGVRWLADQLRDEHRGPGRQGSAGEGTSPQGPSRHISTAAGLAIALVAVGLLVHFAPVWLGTEVPEEVIRRRWWFDGWV